ncbi:glycerate kinase [Anatilimnocola sp. NA78]|uniref:glycerate kinase type-2 family protein n=1 Tax=Anatilimnocola sp. NA78 TaxID=3415683 RepID=UPI003CE4B9EC
MPSPRSAAQLRADALAIWNAAVNAVRSDQLVRDNVAVERDELRIGDEFLSLASIGRIAVVGAGKAGAGMAAGLCQALGEKVVQEKRVSGWLNIPADCVTAESMSAAGPIQLHAARPAGRNEPTADGVAGAEHILTIAGSLRPNDLCLCLISGGGSALLPAPAIGVSLADKQALTRHLSAAGANIEELNTVRKQLSRIKGGGLARACRAGRLIALVISDVLGDPLQIIASGPTVEDRSTPSEALAVLQKFAAVEVAPAATSYLQSRVAAGPAPRPAASVTNVIIGNNAVAVDAGGIEAEHRGYSHAMLAARSLEGPAEEIGVHTANLAEQMRHEAGPDCLITGGEPTVQLAPASIRGKGGRNQQLVLAALCQMLEKGADTLQGAVLLSGGTDGEDGPTDAAGAIIDSETLARMRQLQLDPADYLRRNDAYSFFEQVGGLLKTGPTHTNVCDVRVAVVDRVQPQPR